jgi:type II secretory pathway component PulF
MSVYAYKVIDYSGQSARGAIEAPSEEAATRELGEKGLYIVSIRRSSGWFDPFKHAWVAVRVDRSDVLEFTQNLSVMINAGIPILGCLDDIIASTPNKAFIPIIRDIRKRLERGSSISGALEAHGKLFPDILKTFVALGEETGTLVESLKDAADHLMRMQKLKDAVKKALMYPLLAFIATMGALFFWIFFVIPSLSATLKSLGVKLPALTIALISTSSYAVAHWKQLILLLALVPLIAYLAGRNTRIRYLRDLVLIRAPLLRVVMHNWLMATFSEQFSMLIKGGIGIGRLFDLMIPAIGNEYFGANLRKVRESILNGRLISESFEDQDILPPLALARIRIGEITGTLDNQCAYLAKWYAGKLDDAIDNIGKLIEPLVMVVIGGLFAVIIMGLLLPMYDLVSKAGKL